MPVYTTSRYRTGRAVNVTVERNGETQTLPFIYTRQRVKDVPIALIHVVTAGERLDQIAFKYCGNNSLWWLIADVNGVLSFPLYLPPGTNLKIPTAEVFSSFLG